MEDQIGNSVLIVDDEVQIQKLIKAFLKPHFKFIHTAGSIKEAKAILSTKAYDYLLLDISLGESNGGELIAYIKNGETANKDIPILVISAYFVEDFVIRNKGRIDMLDKPFSKNQLTEKILELKAKYYPNEGPKPIELDESLKAILDNSDKNS